MQGCGRITVKETIGAVVSSVLEEPREHARDIRPTQLLETADGADLGANGCEEGRQAMEVAAGPEVEMNPKESRGIERRLQTANGRPTEVEPLPYIEGLGNSPSGHTVEMCRNESDMKGYSLPGSARQIHCIPEIQMDMINENKGVAYRAMLARIGLDGPGNSNDSGESIPQNSPTHENGNHHFYTPTRKRVSKLTVFSQQRLTLKYQGILKHKGKALVGKR